MKNNETGQLLLEVLVVISVMAVVLTLGSQLVYVSLQSNRSAGERGTALGLLQETLDATRSVANEKWQLLFNLNKPPALYHPEISVGKWVLVAGPQNVIINEVTFARSLAIRNVCREKSTGTITGITDIDGTTTLCAANGGSYDPSMQYVTAQVAWPNADIMVLSEYMSRWMNKLCEQTVWTNKSTGVKNCGDPAYDDESNIDFDTSGTLKIK